MKKPILFIHGFLGGKYDYYFIKRSLKKKGYNKFYEFAYKDNYGNISIEKNSQKLIEYIKNNIIEKSFNVIAISQGGIIAIYALLMDRKLKYNKIITIATPFNGSYFAYFYKMPGFIDLRPKSKVLESINYYILNNPINLFSLFTPFDLMVFPGTNAIPPRGIVQKIFAPFHPMCFYWPKSIKFIEKSLAENFEKPSIFQNSPNSRV